MNELFAWMLDHQSLVWLMFFLPLVACMLRFAVLEARKPSRTYDKYPEYGWVFVCGLIPVINLAIASLCVLVTVVEIYKRLR